MVVALGPVVGACSRRASPTRDGGAMGANAPTAAWMPEECRACRGDWGRHGLSEQEGCNCRTNDAGKRCSDGADCEGVCLVAEKRPEFEPVKGVPGRGYFVGRCSEFVTAWSCNRIIDRGARARGPVALGEAPLMMCRD